MTLLLIHATATWFMVGLIWTIQLVHYPLFARVGDDEFAGYENEHTRRMGRLLVIPAGVEVVTGAALVWGRPAEVELPVVMIAGALLAVAWIVTALVQVPLHSRLERGYSAAVAARLVSTNWLRTGLWTARGVAVAVMLAA
jgi:hypothetical protein